MKWFTLFAILPTLFWFSGCGASDPLPVMYFGNDGPEQYESGASLRNGQLHLARKHRQRLHWEHGLAQALVEKHWYYLKPDGKSLAVITYDNGADYFEEGLVRVLVDGKVSYFDTDFAQAIPPKYDWAWPFEDGRALVCDGCRIAGHDGDEHRMMEGGEWGYIDHQGREVVPVKFSFDEIMARKNGE